MKSTPFHATVNAELLSLVPANAARVIDVGCMGGALAQAYLKINPACDYVGIEMNPDYAELARQHCRKVVVASIEELGTEEFQRLLPADCWIFGDVLEHLHDPWSLLGRIRSVSSDTTCIVACVPNAQHWSVQQRLCSGLFRYEAEGLLDRTHIRWFTGTTLIELFDSAGFAVVQGLAKIHPTPMPKEIGLAIATLAQAAGADPDTSVRNAVPYQWVVKAMPKPAPKANA
jgi:SAM-dependent methyltransferase